MNDTTTRDQAAAALRDWLDAPPVVETMHERFDHECLIQVHYREPRPAIDDALRQLLICWAERVDQDVTFTDDWPPVEFLPDQGEPDPTHFTNGQVTPDVPPPMRDPDLAGITSAPRPGPLPWAVPAAA